MGTTSERGGVSPCYVYVAVLHETQPGHINVTVNVTPVGLSCV